MEYVKSLFSLRPVAPTDPSPPPPPSTLVQPKIMADRFLCPRTETVRTLAEMLDQSNVVHVRGTPASGKTTLAQLLHSYYLERDIPAVFIPCWPVPGSIPASPSSYLNILVQECHIAGYTDINQSTLRDTDIVLILDEGQMSYGDQGLWLGFVKTQNGRRSGPRICVFTSYGSPSGGPSDFTQGSPLSFLGVEQRVSITISPMENSPRIGLFYSRDEFDDVVRRLSADPRRPLRLHTDAKDYVFELTSGHAGAVEGVIGMIERVYRSDLKHSRIEEVTKDHIIDLLDDEEKSFGYLSSTSVKRSFVDLRRVTVEAVAALKATMIKGSIPRDLTDAGIKTCYENGWLHSEPLDLDATNLICVYPTRLHLKFVERYLYNETPIPFPFGRFPTIESLAKAALKKLSSRSICNTTQLSTGAVIPPVEVVYQDAFFKALNDVLGFASRVSSEWSPTGKGRIDFRLLDVPWGFEFLRENNRLPGHCERFTDGGSYKRWITKGWLQDWLIINFCTSSADTYDVPDAKLWHAVLSDDFSSLEVLDARNRVLIPRFPLTS
ncbi:hypothetical protein K440DRAFT_601858 [Wilcoxina mikolae CBS 423.85]|nr:hypothetical protein K440DRAFT_601858 [Wilcoxina mikolae CBS 423.85]